MSIVTAEQVLMIWQADARARGRFPTQMPDGPYRGQLAERYVDPSGTLRYELAPPDVESVHQAMIAQENNEIAWGVRVQMMQDALTGAAKYVARLPRELIEEALGLPSWFIASLIAGAALLLGRHLWSSGR